MVEAMGCIVGGSVIEPGRDHFVYVTDLYCSVPAPVSMNSEETEKIKARLNDGASGSCPSEDKSSASSEDLRSKGKASEASSVSKMKKSVWWTEAEKGIEEEVDGHVEEFILKFYDDISLQRQKDLVDYCDMLERRTTSS